MPWQIYHVLARSPHHGPAAGRLHFKSDHSTPVALKTQHVEGDTLGHRNCHNFFLRKAIISRLMRESLTFGARCVWVFLCMPTKTTGGPRPVLPNSPQELR